MLLWILRGCYVALILGVGLFFLDRLPPETGFGVKLLVLVGVLLVGGAVLAADMLIRDKQITTISAVYFGLLLGLLLGTILTSALDPFLAEWFKELVSGPERERTLVNIREAFRLLVTLICCYISVSTLLQTKDEFRFIIPYVEFSKQVKGGRPLVHAVDLAQLRQVGLVHLQLHLGVVLQPLEDVQPAPAAVALQLVGAVGDALQLLEDEARHDQLGVDEPRITDIGNPAVDDDTGVQHQRPSPLHLLGKLHVGDDEPELVLGLQQRRDGDVATGDGDDEFHRELGRGG